MTPAKAAPCAMEPLRRKIGQLEGRGNVGEHSSLGEIRKLTCGRTGPSCGTYGHDAVSATLAVELRHFRGAAIVDCGRYNLLTMKRRACSTAVQTINLLPHSHVVPP